MSIRFLTEEQQQSYGRYVGDPTPVQLARYFHSPSVLFDLTTAQLVENKILLPGVSVLVRLISSVRERVAKRLWLLLSKLPNAEQTNQLEALLFVNEKTRQTLLEQLRRSPTRTSPSALVNALNRLVTIRSLGIRQLPVAKIPPTRSSEIRV